MKNHQSNQSNFLKCFIACIAIVTASFEPLAAQAETAGCAYTTDSNQYMGLTNTVYVSSLIQMAPNYYLLGTCQ